MLAALLLAATLSVEDYATMPQVSAPHWSPDGTRIVYVVTKADLTRPISAYDSDLWLIDADGRNDRRLTSATGADFRPRWSPDGSRIAFLSDRAGGRNAIHVLDPRGGEPRLLSNEPTPVRDFEWSPDGRWIAFARIDEAKETEPRVVGENERAVHLYVLDAETGKSRQLTDDDRTIFDLDWSPDSSEIVVSRAKGLGLDALHQTDIDIVKLDGTMRSLVQRPGHDRFPRWSPDGKSIAFTSAGGTNHWLVEFEVHVIPATGGTPRKVAPAYDRTPDSHAWAKDSRTLWIEGPWNGLGQLFRVNADGTNFTSVLPNTQATDADVFDGRIAYIRQSFTTPPELWVDQRQLTHHNDAYANRELGETRVITWKNPKDGLEIEGFLTLPAGYKSGRVPLLTFVHGGPASHFDEGFLGYLGHIYAPQAMAAKGFAVLRPNPRGTGGYGRAFRIANEKDWGGMDWIDINAGIDKLIAAGIADPQRLGLMGWSYGGFMASWALGHSDRFKAISIGAPVVDLISFHGTSDIRHFIPSYFGGMSHDLLRAHSPLTFLHKTKVKVLIQHGDADERVPLSQGTMLYRALDELGADVQMVVYPRTPHVPREPRLRIDIARRNVEFFEKALR